MSMFLDSEKFLGKKQVADTGRVVEGYILNCYWYLSPRRGVVFGGE